MKEKLPSLSRIKKALYADWALRVKQRDGWKCLLCGSTENLTAHHWCVSDHHAKGARYAVDNGVTLCYACHIRHIHTRADYVSVKGLRDKLVERTPINEEAIDLFSRMELTTNVLRNLWDTMRARPIEFRKHDFWVEQKGGKIFVKVLGDYPVAVVGNTVMMPDEGLCEVLTVAKIEPSPPFYDYYRYTLRKI